MQSNIIKVVCNLCARQSICKAIYMQGNLYEVWKVVSRTRDSEIQDTIISANPSVREAEESSERVPVSSSGQGASVRGLRFMEHRHTIDYTILQHIIIYNIILISYNTIT